MKVIDILKTKHTVLSSVDGYYFHQGVYDYTQTKMDLNTILFKLGKKYKDAIDKLRELEYHSDEQQKYKQEFPTWFVGGTFPFQQTDDIDIIEYSNILAIDIDKKDNKDKDLNIIRKTLFELPYVFAVFKSISGAGYYVLILVEDGKYTKEYYKYISRLWSKNYGLNIDTQCTNIGRKRFLSYEDNIEKWIKSNETDIQSWKLKYIEKEKPIKSHTTISISKYKNNDNGYVRRAIWKLLNNGYSIDDFLVKDKNNAYGTWYHIACDFHHFEDGLDMFIKFSQNSTKYNDKIQDITKKYNNGKKEKTYEDVVKKWCGICKRIYGKEWYKD